MRPPSPEPQVGTWDHPDLTRLRELPGILGVHVQAKDAQPIGLCGHAISVARLTKEDVMIQFQNQKILVCLWPCMDIAVRVAQGHAVNKSLRRTLDRIGRRIGGVGVQSPACASPRAASSSGSTGPSSPSRVGSTAPTGDSQAEPPNPESNPS